MDVTFQDLSQLLFSVAVAWYLLTIFSKKMDRLSDQIEKSAAFSEDAAKMFTEIKDLIKETSHLVTNSSESVKIMSELTKNALRQLEEQRWQSRREKEIYQKKDRYEE